jgi:hypothetical protein
MLMTPKSISSPDLSPELQARISTCLLDISTWMSHRYLKLHMSEMQFIFYFFLPPTQPALSSVTHISVDGSTIHPVDKQEIQESS